MQKLLNNKNFIVAVRVIGWVYFIIMLVNTIFFYGKYLYKTPISSGFWGCIAGGMMNYKFNWKKVAAYKRVLLICFDILLLILVGYIIYSRT